jgi:hypothetical protein
MAKPRARKTKQKQKQKQKQQQTVVINIGKDIKRRTRKSMAGGRGRPKPLNQYYGTPQTPILYNMHNVGADLLFRDVIQPMKIKQQKEQALLLEMQGLKKDVKDLKDLKKERSRWLDSVDTSEINAQPTGTSGDLSVIAPPDDANLTAMQTERPVADLTTQRQSLNVIGDNDANESSAALAFRPLADESPGRAHYNKGALNSLTSSFKSTFSPTRSAKVSY